MKKIDISELSPCQKTLFLPVWARATESKKIDPIIFDECALEIIDKVNFDFSVLTKNLQPINQLSWIARNKRFDLIIKEFIKKNPNSTIVNIGCGLDTTYERIGEKHIRWYDLDLPEVINLRREFLFESEVRKFISSSFMETSWFDNIPYKENVLFIATGVFEYFNEFEIRKFVKSVASTFKNSEMFFDVTSPKGVQIANSVIKQSGFSHESFFKWGLTDKTVISSWDPGIKIINTYYTFRIKGLNISFRDRILGMLSDMAGVMYMIHLKIA